MLNSCKSRTGFATDTLGGRIRRDELRMFRLQLLELVHQLVESGVADFGLVQHVVAVLVIADLVAQGFEFLLDVFGRRGH